MSKLTTLKVEAGRLQRRGDWKSLKDCRRYLSCYIAEIKRRIIDGHAVKIFSPEEFVHPGKNRTFAESSYRIMAGASNFMEEFFEAFPQAKTGELSLEDLNGLLAQFQRILNDKLVADFDGLSPNEMHQLLYNPLGPGSPISISSSLNPDLLQNCPIFVLSELLLFEIKKAGQLKLTSKGNLPVSLCRLLHDQKLIEHKYRDSIKQITEDNIIYITPLKLFLLHEGYIKKRNNHLSLTKKGETSLSSPATERFKSLFLFFTQRLNWVAFNDYVEAPVGQTGWSYTLYLLGKYGDKPQRSTYYSNLLMKAFYEELWQHRDDLHHRAAVDNFHWAFQFRFFEIFASWFGLVQITAKENLSHYREVWVLHSTPLCRALVR